MKKTTVDRTATVANALSSAKLFQCPMMLCEMDHEDGRIRRIRKLEYSNEDEFCAFDGRILAIAYPDGSTD